MWLATCVLGLRGRGLEFLRLLVHLAGVWMPICKSFAKSKTKQRIGAWRFVKKMIRQVLQHDLLKTWILTGSVCHSLWRKKGTLCVGKHSLTGSLVESMCFGNYEQFLSFSGKKKKNN